MPLAGAACNNKPPEAQPPANVHYFIYYDVFADRDKRKKVKLFVFTSDSIFQTSNGIKIFSYI